MGLLCAALGASQVLLTDYEPHVLTHLDRNAALNGLQQRCASLRLDWREPAASLAPHQLAAWRVVVAADVLYASAVVQPLIATLQLLLHSEGEAGWVSRLVGGLWVARELGAAAAAAEMCGYDGTSAGDATAASSSLAASPSLCPA